MDVTVRGMPRVSGVNALLEQCDVLVVRHRSIWGPDTHIQWDAGDMQWDVRFAAVWAARRGADPFWAVPRSRDESFIGRDASGQALAYSSSRISRDGARLPVARQ
jgi:hypothetical protein